MKYILGLLFEYKRFKKNAIIRISSDNTLIDELVLEKDIDYVEKITSKCPMQYLKTKYCKRNSLKILPYAKKYFRMPEKIFLYEIDGDFVNNSVQLEFIVSDTNATNGFMTEYAYVVIRDIFLLPKKILNKSAYLSIFPRLYKPHKNIAGNKVWPSGIPAAKIIRNAEEKDLNNLEVLGGNFTVRIPVIKKHKIKMFAREDSSTGIFYLDYFIVAWIRLYKLLNRVK